MAAVFSSPDFSRRAPVIGLLVIGASAITACGAPADRARIEPTYDRATGRLELLKYDANGDGKVDTWSHMDGAQIVRIDIDTNHDDVPDRWEYYRADGQLEKVGSSRRQDGSPDSWAYYGQGGSIARLELATHPGGTVDRIEHYEKGAIVRAEEDTTGDGRIDKWEVYDGPRLASVAFDTTERGYPDHRLVYSADGSARPEAVSPLTDGR
ncbi:MAG: hypothetical protein ABW292_16760 [Vicinamibacterales bacterium]